MSDPKLNIKSTAPTQTNVTPTKIAPATRPERIPTEEILAAILTDAARRPQEFVDSWHVPGGAE